MAHLDLTPKHDVSSFRKLAIGTWKTTYDPTVYGTLALRADKVLAYLDAFRQKTGKRATLSHLMAKAVAIMLSEMPDANAILRRNRIYLPQEDLGRFGVTSSSLLRGQPSGDFLALMQFQYERAADTYERAYASLPAEDRKAQRPGLAMAAIYRALLDEIRRDSFRVLEHRVALTPLRKLWIAWKTYRFA